MRITESQLRRIIREEIEYEMDEDPGLYVVIGNRGRGLQELYPNSRNPQAYTQAEAEAIVKRLSDTSGYYTVAWHYKPLYKAREYITPGLDAESGLVRLIDDVEGMR